MTNLIFLLWIIANPTLIRYPFKCNQCIIWINFISNSALWFCNFRWCRCHRVRIVEHDVCPMMLLYILTNLARDLIIYIILKDLCRFLQIFEFDILGMLVSMCAFCSMPKVCIFNSIFSCVFSFFHSHYDIWEFHK